MDAGHLKRPSTGTRLLSASRRDSVYEHVPQVPAYSLVAWSLGRASVIWRIWPAVLLHTVFAIAIVTLDMKGIMKLQIPGIMLTVLGVVIGFVISYRASSGYDRYWMGRTCWSDVMKNARTLGRLVWFHVPLRLTPKTPEEVTTGKLLRLHSELEKIMHEKRTALDLIEGFAVSLKHHLRGELGFTHEDLYHLVRPLHDHGASAPSAGRRPQRISNFPPIPEAISQVSATAAEQLIVHSDSFVPSPGPNASTALGASNGLTSAVDPHILYQPAGIIQRKGANDNAIGHTHNGHVDADDEKHGLIETSRFLGIRSQVAGGGQNLPLEILHCLSEWFSVLEDRGTVPGTSLGNMINALAAFEDNLTALERILTTPLPFVYSVHIRTVWLYLFFLPFQLVHNFGWYTIPGVAMAAFIYLGFVAAGEEIEQPFGYDENDLDLDLFCREIVHKDIERLKYSPCLNAYLGPTTKNG